MNKLRIISGLAGGRKLSMVPGTGTRPISDRVKQALFNILSPDIVSAKLLDLFAGTGSVGIEALSRGAAYVRFLDRNQEAVETIKRNLASTGLGQSADVLTQDAFSLLAQHPDTAFDYVYIAPPQHHEMWIDALQALDAKPNWLVDDGWIVVQIHPKEYEPVELANFSEFDQRKYSNTLLIFYERELK